MCNRTPVPSGSSVLCDLRRARRGAPLLCYLFRLQQNLVINAAEHCCHLIAAVVTCTRPWFSPHAGGTYEGEFSNGLPNGLGVRTLSSGQVKAGRWKDGVLLVRAWLAAALSCWGREAVFSRPVSCCVTFAVSCVALPCHVNVLHQLLLSQRQRSAFREHPPSALLDSRYSF